MAFFNDYSNEKVMAIIQAYHLSKFKKIISTFLDSRFHGNDSTNLVIPAKDLQCQPPKMKEG